MSDPLVLPVALALSIALNAWFILFLIVLAYENAQLAPARSGGGTSSTAGSRLNRSPALLTPR